MIRSKDCVFYIHSAIFRAEALACFHPDPLSWWNWNLECYRVFVEGGKPEDPEKNPRSKTRANSKLNLPLAPGGTLVGGERSRHCDIPCSLLSPDETNELATNGLSSSVEPNKWLLTREDTYPGFQF